MRLRERLRQSVRSFNIEVLALWFVFLDRRVRWYTKVFLIIPIAYVVSPFDLLRDTMLGWGQVDDLVVLRASHFLLSRLLDTAVMADSREQAAAFLDGGRKNRITFYLAAASVWGMTLFVAFRWLARQIFRHA